MSINETVLEMHFHKPLMELFSSTLGLGAGAFNFYKYSPQRECFVGFDQAFIRSDLSDQEMFEMLKSSATTNRYSLSSTFIGLFLQYKVVKQIQRRTRHTPPVITSRPYLRASLDTKKNINTGFSQHELLYNLNINVGAFVYYACPMLFDRTELYNTDPDLELMRLADVTSCPGPYSDNDSHFIYFNDTDATPIWCSEPVEGKAVSPKQMVVTIGQQLQVVAESDEDMRLWDKLFSPIELSKGEEKTRPLDVVHETLTILEFLNEEQT
ncbi:hypothetical protein [Flexistipes sp.]|uniref:hypothetical protein n=1 Tax=Flexistipes sp. TaxID=3088135 RepID=UPI002E1E3496|nr:hypothetical protein [Flexistipes sp.]